jgi:hypothetical protein
MAGFGLLLIACSAHQVKQVGQMAVSVFLDEEFEMPLNLTSLAEFNTTNSIRSTDK